MNHDGTVQFDESAEHDEAFLAQFGGGIAEDEAFAFALKAYDDAAFAAEKATSEEEKQAARKVLYAAEQALKKAEENALQSYPHDGIVRGIVNEGDQCYMHAAIQLLFAVEGFRQKVLEYTGVDNRILALKAMFVEMMRKDISEPIDTKDIPVDDSTVYKILVQNHEQNDPEEYIRSFLFNDMSDSVISDFNVIITNYPTAEAIRSSESGSPPITTGDEYIYSLNITNKSGPIESIKDAIEYSQTMDGKRILTVKPTTRYLLISLSRYQYIDMSGETHTVPIKHDVEPTLMLNISGVMFRIKGVIVHTGVANKNSGHYRYIQYTPSGSLEYVANDSNVGSIDQQHQNDFNAMINKGGLLYIYERLDESGKNTSLEEVAAVSVASLENGDDTSSFEKIAAVAVGCFEKDIDLGKIEGPGAGPEVPVTERPGAEGPTEGPTEGLETRKPGEPISSNWASPYFDFEHFNEHKKGHIADCKANKIPSSECNDMYMADDIKYAMNIAQEYRDTFEDQPEYKSYLDDLYEYYSLSGEVGSKEKQEFAKKFHKKYPASKVEIFNNTPMLVANPFVAYYYRKQDGISFANPTTFNSSAIDQYGKNILKSNTNILNKVAHKELITNTPVAAAYLASLWACSNNPLMTDDPRCAFSSIYSELIDYYQSKDKKYGPIEPVEPKAKNGKKTAPFYTMPLRPRRRDELLPPPPPPLSPSSDVITPIPSPSPSPVPVPTTPETPVPATPTTPVPATPITPVPATPTTPPLAITIPTTPPVAHRVRFRPVLAQADREVLSRVRYTPILTKGFGSGKYFRPSPGFGSGIVW